MASPGRSLLIVLAVAGWSVAGGPDVLAAAPPASEVDGVPRPAPSSTPSRPSTSARVFRGIASWYGHPHHGLRTASGERFDASAMTAAHRNLPFGTWLLVENVKNGRRVKVRINDRGPHIRGRVLDLSRGAARALGAPHGLIDVRYRVIRHQD